MCRCDPLLRKETGLYYYRARCYKPEIGRFLQVDPVGYRAGMNLYLYCHNDPAILNDPYGQDSSDNYPKRDPLHPRTGEWVWEHEDCWQWYGAERTPLDEELASVTAKLADKGWKGVRNCAGLCSVIPIGTIVYIRSSMYVPGQGLVVAAVGTLLYFACIATCEAVLYLPDWIELRNRAEELKAKIAGITPCFEYCWCRANGENHEACKKHLPAEGCPSFFREYRDRTATGE